MNLNIEKIIETEKIKMFFQPIVSLKKKSIIGVEALLRGIDPQNEIIPPLAMFKAANEKNLEEELDILAKKVAMKEFDKGKLDLDNFLLFLNVEVSDLSNQSNYQINNTMRSILKWSKKLKIEPRNIVIEILESKATSMKSLKELTYLYRQHGFLIALDDVGSGHSNLSRISCLKPDIIKVDRSLIKGIDKNYFKQDVFKSLVLLGEKIGSLVLAEGVENKQECFKAMELGADLLQGYFIGFPYVLTHEKLGYLSNKLISLHKSYKKYLDNILRHKKNKFDLYEAIIEIIASSIEDSSENEINSTLTEYVYSYPFIECIYILDKNGFQIGETIIAEDTFYPKKKNFMFHPAKSGEDHSLKEYFYKLKHRDFNKYITDPYISLASGNRCITISKKVYDFTDLEFIMCLDININNAADISNFEEVNSDKIFKLLNA
ncbi:MAG: EAL domain-containing protein [Fusobacteriota bacterium]